MRIVMILALLMLPSACNRLENIGKAPEFTPVETSTERDAMIYADLPSKVAVDRASLWTAGPRSLLGDRRALVRGDILTVVIEIDEKAEISNSSSRQRSATEDLAIPQLLGLPQRLDEHLPEGASLADAVDLSGASRSSGDGQVRRKEKLTLRVAATVVEVLPNGVLAISGRQEVRVNFEMRELLVSGYVRPEDISRLNEITYDKIASARISYGGRGQITDVQQPRYGQQVLDVILPF